MKEAQKILANYGENNQKLVKYMNDYFGIEDFHERQQQWHLIKDLKIAIGNAQAQLVRLGLMDAKDANYIVW